MKSQDKQEESLYMEMDWRQRRTVTVLTAVLLTLLAAVLLAGGVTLLALWCQPNSFRGLLSGFLRQPLLIVLNALPVGLLLLAAAALLRNAVLHRGGGRRLGLGE